MTLSRKAAICVSDTAWRAIIKVALVVLLASSVEVRAWSEAGHLMVTELAVRQLPGPERERLNDSARALPNPDLEALRERYGPVSPLSALGAWLDGQRGKTVAEIFAEHDVQLPAQLQAYRQSTTNDWHYSNKLYFLDEQKSANQGAVDRRASSQRQGAEPCDHLHRGELNAVLPRLAAAYQDTAADRGRALILAMLVHLVADAHQPLHSITGVRDDCEHDRGGNGFCVTYAAGGRCKNSLHRLWDGGFGAFHQKSLDETLQFLAAADVKGAPGALAPERWQQENFALASQIYAPRAGAGLSSGYRDWALEVVRQRANVGAERLANILSELVD